MRRVAEDDLLLKHFQQLKSVDSRHDHVQKDQGVILLLGLLQSGLGGVDHRNRVIRGQDGTEEVRLNRTVVNDQNFLHILLLLSCRRQQRAVLFAGKGAVLNRALLYQTCRKEGSTNFPHSTIFSRLFC